MIAYKNVFDDKPISETAKNLINWYVTTVIPIVHVSSRARNNWRPFASVSGAYSTIVTSSDGAFTERHNDEKADDDDMRRPTMRRPTMRRPTMMRRMVRRLTTRKKTKARIQKSRHQPR